MSWPRKKGFSGKGRKEKRMPFNSSKEPVDYDDQELMGVVIEELKRVGYINSAELAKKANSKEIRYKLGELYAKDLLKTQIITRGPDGFWAEKLYRIYYTVGKFRKKYGGV
jgi:hypothetical protein